ncbi:hypothetical protein [Deinococcus soli (ex Cha et al. 2016)]|uniref:Uncharacterized protein n=2 Tax=Deinococcus soli (ex Cha et al. 2016) TaxID=1309411 RepID=A0AAE3XBZ8_9DEIO|nr:hypothetical protein [Deinococcus soli (ex Cha et al. 2016)]MDR6219015.1 hypothetical protein [Deinococcus soli (ex Cha et al. 2016)]MDR6328812.1 hypothetical protein [Deinococcus soli (ex Cha et al. 2016)]MDR6751701.1 hypothetical protein [Deinococcus soli (ex Cha et al. 2016)]
MPTATQKLSATQLAQSNPYHVTAGQIWEDADPRMNGRQLQVHAISGAYAECYQVIKGTTLLAPGEHTRQNNGKPRRIRLDRFKPTSTGYRLLNR